MPHGGLRGDLPGLLGWERCRMVKGCRVIPQSHERRQRHRHRRLLPQPCAVSGTRDSGYEALLLSSLRFGGLPGRFIASVDRSFLTRGHSNDSHVRLRDRPDREIEHVLLDRPVVEGLQRTVSIVLTHVSRVDVQPCQFLSPHRPSCGPDAFVRQLQRQNRSVDDECSATIRFRHEAEPTVPVDGFR